MEFASKAQPNGISAKKVRELAMRKVDPLPLRHDELGVYMLRSEFVAWRQRQKRTYLEARELGLIPGVIKA